jgi:DNA polymerase elongation subunit (family B)
MKEETPNIEIYDLEVFPNFFSATFFDPESNETDVFVIAVKLGINDSEKMRGFLNQKILLVGYNNLSYDAPMLQYVCDYKYYNSAKFNTDIFTLSSKLVSNDTRNDATIRKLKYAKNDNWKQMDLMKFMTLDQLGVSLKQIAINLKWYRIQDLPLPYDHDVTKEEVDLILDYNLNDVMISYELYKAVQPQIQLRVELTKLYNVDLTNASDSKMANQLLEKFYQEETGVDIAEIKDLRTVRKTVKLSDCIVPEIEFQTKELQALYNDISSLTVTIDGGYKYSKTLHFGGTEYELGVGGLHSNDAPGMFVAKPELAIRDADVASYYPNIIINNNIKPLHLGENFVDILRKITYERIGAKKSGNKVKADGLKITINSIFGKLGSEMFWLQDNQAMLSVTVSGQLTLLMLIEALEIVGIHTISANTDGIVCEVPITLESKYKEVCEWWQKKTNYELEFTDYSLYVRSDVNNYITKKLDGKTKEKGGFVKTIELKKGYHYPIVATAVYEYFIHNKPIDDTLKEAKDVLDFCISQKSAKEFQVVYQTVTGETELQKTNRFYVSNRGGALVKVEKSTGKRIGMYVGNTISLLNTFDSSLPIASYDINYRFYRDEILKRIKPIEDVAIEQLDIFGDLDSSNVIPATVGKKAASSKKRTILQIKSDNFANFLYPDVDKRYIYLIKVDKMIDTYCLCNGKQMQIRVRADVMRKTLLKEGMIIYGETFKQQGDTWYLESYRILSPKEKEEIFDGKSKAAQVTMF